MKFISLQSRARISFFPHPAPCRRFQLVFFILAKQASSGRFQRPFCSRVSIFFPSCLASLNYSVVPSYRLLLRFRRTMIFLFLSTPPGVRCGRVKMALPRGFPAILVTWFLLTFFSYPRFGLHLLRIFSSPFFIPQPSSDCRDASIPGALSRSLFCLYSHPLRHPFLAFSKVFLQYCPAPFCRTHSPHFIYASHPGDVIRW